MEPSIQLEDGTRLYACQTEADFRATPTGQTLEIMQQYGVHTLYHLGRQKIEGREFAIILQFENGLLTWIKMAYPASKSWNDYNLDREKQAVEDNTAWVKRVFGEEPPISFENAGIYSDLEMRDKANLVSICFKCPGCTRP